MLETEITINRFLCNYRRMLTVELPDERLAEQPTAGVNHPAWILGHLTFAAERAVAIINGGENALPEPWQKLFGIGSKPTNVRSDYPPKEELLKAFEASHERLQRAAAAATPEQLARPSQNPRTKDQLPTIRESIGFLLTGHMGVHLGQLTMWRRMIGLPALF